MHSGLQRLEVGDPGEQVVMALRHFSCQRGYGEGPIRTVEGCKGAGLVIESTAGSTHRASMSSSKGLDLRLSAVAAEFSRHHVQ
jgi:hypothetical protein